MNNTNQDINKKPLDKNLKMSLIVVAVVVGIMFILFLATTVIPKALITLTKASSSERVVTSSSYLIGDKILAKADGEDGCIVNVFLLDKNSKGVKGKTVELTGIDKVEELNSLSDSDGKISFKLTSTEEKQYRINANYSGQPLPQTIVVTFRN